MKIVDRLRALPVLGLFVRTVEKALQDGAKDAAASIAYFSFFSLFPLLLALVVGATFLFEPLDMQARLDDFLSQSLPGSAELVGEILEGVIRLRGSVGLLSVLALLWSASAAFGAASRAINRAWQTTTDTPFYVSRLGYVAICLAVSLLFFLSAGVTAVAELVVGLNQSWLDTLGISDWLTRSGARLLSFAFLFSMFALLYKVMPRAQTRWSEIWPGALFAAVLVEGAKYLFVRYLEDVANLEAVYGSLSSVIVLLLWLYLTAWILVLGAELIDVRRSETRVEPV